MTIHDYIEDLGNFISDTVADNGDIPMYDYNHYQTIQELEKLADDIETYRVVMRSFVKTDGELAETVRCILSGFLTTLRHDLLNASEEIEKYHKILEFEAEAQAEEDAYRAGVKAEYAATRGVRSGPLSTGPDRRLIDMGV